VPQDAHVNDASLDYTSHYVFDAASRTLQIERRLSARFGHQMCTADEFAQMRDALLRIERDTHAQIVVRSARAPAGAMTGAQPPRVISGTHTPFFTCQSVEVPFLSEPSGSRRCGP